MTPSVRTRATLWYAGNGPRWLAPAIARLHPSVQCLDADDECWRVETADGTVYVSDPRQLVRVAGSMSTRVYEKYTLEGFATVEEGDTVLDIGAFIGEFSRAVADRAGAVVALEPDERNRRALERNLAPFEHASVVNGAAWNETGEATFNVAADPSEGSLLTVDHSGPTGEATLDAFRIDDLARERDLDRIDFLKLEAEGAEPEALEGLGEFPVETLAIECSPERDGRSPEPELKEWLTSRNYETQTRDSVLFARLSD